MSLLTKISRGLHRRRAEADRSRPGATRQQAGDAEQLLRESRRTQNEARAEAFERILRQARGAS